MFLCVGVGELSETQRRAARRLLHQRFPSTHNHMVIDKLLGFSHGGLHCHHANRELGRSELNEECYCAMGMVGGQCVVAAVFHRKPPASRSKGSSALLLLAVQPHAERRGYGTGMVQYIRRQSAEAGASLLVVIAAVRTPYDDGELTNPAFWMRPALRLATLTTADAQRLKLFVPWSDGVRPLCSSLDAAEEVQARYISITLGLERRRRLRELARLVRTRVLSCPLGGAAAAGWWRGRRGR